MHHDYHTGDDDPQPDSGTIRDQIDPDVSVRTDHVALDGGQHILPENLERYAADLLPVAAWKGGAA